MGHENSVTVQKHGPSWYVVNGHDGSVLGGPFNTSHEADNYAKIRTNMFNEAPGGLKELGDLGSLMDEGYESSPTGVDTTPRPTEYGPLQHSPDGGLDETDYGTYSAQMPKGPHMMPSGQMMGGLKQLAQAQNPQEDSFTGLLKDAWRDVKTTPLSSWTKKPEDTQTVGDWQNLLFGTGKRPRRLPLRGMAGDIPYTPE